MPVFVHLASHRDLPAIRRGGIALVKRRGVRARAVYALPVTRNFNLSHQWLRELRRHGGGFMLGIYFRLPPDEPVELGHYHLPHRTVSAAEAVALMLAAEGRDPAAARAADAASGAVQRGRALPASPEGYEVLIPRAIARSEILRVKALPQVAGWRYRPGAHGRPPVACLRGERGAWGLRRLERAVEAAEAAGLPSATTLFSREASSFRRVERLQAARKGKGETKD
ncbi:MAG: hypothetical protein JOZ90_08675 [Alphaproteobacteria bacterium]|nr:hypothetical protein [Alphaproteobacteria bacterium]MBV9370312.1 hypothetical protein [Alphaproteobacteria bacterium]MBV9901158.1 hypothetical protein [Alphaproteobacteria bacterium]